MLDFIYSIIDMVKAFFHDISVIKVLIIFFAYAFLLSKTTLGLILRFLTVLFIYYIYSKNAENGNTIQGIKEALAVALLFYWPLILKNCIVLFTRLMDIISKKLEEINLEHKNKS